MTTVTTPAPVSTAAASSVETAEKTPAKSYGYDILQAFRTSEEGKVYEDELDAIIAAEYECYKAVKFLMDRWFQPALTRQAEKAQKAADVPILENMVAYFEKFGLEFKGFPEPTKTQFHENAKVLNEQYVKFSDQHVAQCQLIVAKAIEYASYIDSIAEA